MSSSTRKFPGGGLMFSGVKERLGWQVEKYPDVTWGGAFTDIGDETKIFRQVTSRLQEMRVHE
ncbi:hypothetical protein J6590_085710 [Homalodisca vitripennis]|nr:hypothetical protein J6590_085710 [Homalodisca vitripennis]